MNFFKFYNSQLTQYPLRTKVITSGCMFGLGDCIAQNIIEKKEKHDFKRTMNLVIFGSIFAGPVLHKWYGYLPQLCDKLVFNRYPKMSQFSKTVTATFFDQTIFAVFFNSYFFLAINYLEYFSLEKGFTAVREKIKDTVLANWKLWPAAQMINFYFVPLPYRVLFVNFIGLIWNVYLSFVQHSH